MVFAKITLVCMKRKNQSGQESGGEEHYDGLV